MAVKTRVELVDDIDGTLAHETVKFGIDGVMYEIDLSDRNASALRDEMRKWISCSRRVGGRRINGTPSSPKAKTTEIRNWANSNGYQVSARGRVNAEIRKAYYDAHQS